MTAQRSRRRPRLTLDVRKTRYVADPEALLVLSDREHHECNFPEIRLVLREVGTDHDPRVVSVELKFQRHVATNPHGAASGFMDTCCPWSTAYAGQVDLSHRARSVEIADRPFRHHRDDEVRLQLVRRAARTIDEHNLHLVTADECARVVLAIERLGLTVRMMYERDQGGLVPLVGVDGRYANDRVIQAARAAAQPALPAPAAAGESTDESR